MMEIEREVIVTVGPDGEGLELNEGAGDDEKRPRKRRNPLDHIPRSIATFVIKN